MKRYLGVTEEEMVENQKLWREENEENANKGGVSPDFRNLGVTPGGVQGDIDNFAAMGAPAAGAGPARRRGVA